MTVKNIPKVTVAASQLRKKAVFSIKFNQLVVFLLNEVRLFQFMSVYFVVVHG